DDGVFPGNVRSDLAAAPVEGLVDDDRLRHAASIVAPVEREILARAARAIAEMRIAPDQSAGKVLAGRVWQQLVGIEAVTVLRLIGAVHTVAIDLPRRDVVQVAVPDILAALRQFDALELAAAEIVEQAQLDLGRVGGKQREIGAAAVPACTEACMASGCQSHLSVFRYQENGGQGRDGDAELGGLRIESEDLAGISDIGAAVMRGIRIEDFAPLAAQGAAAAG